MTEYTGYVESARRDGARFWTGGSGVATGEPAAGFCFAPTVLDEVAPSAAVVREDFGPVLVAASFVGEDEAIAAGNETEFGLGAGVWTTDINRAIRVARALRAGTMWVNTYRAVSAAAPFGGRKRSGIGRGRGIEGLLKFTQVKNMMMAVSD